MDEVFSYSKNSPFPPVLIILIIIVIYIYIYFLYFFVIPLEIATIDSLNHSHKKFGTITASSIVAAITVVVVVTCYAVLE